MSDAHVRPGRRDDLPRLTEIYNYYVVNTPITFDLEQQSVERRGLWMDQFAESGRHRLLVAEVGGAVVGYAGTTRFRAKPGYDTTVETTVYCSPDSAGQGLGRLLYGALFASIAREDIRRIVAGYVPPNAASAALHQRFGFQPVGVFPEVGFKFGRYWDVAWLERPLLLPKEDLDRAPG
jgi:phosphinothricin acetyltransferase